MADNRTLQKQNSTETFINAGQNENCWTEIRRLPKQDTDRIGHSRTKNHILYNRVCRTTLRKRRRKKKRTLLIKLLDKIAGNVNKDKLCTRAKKPSIEEQQALEACKKRRTTEYNWNRNRAFNTRPDCTN